MFESLEDRCLLAASPALLSTIEGFNIDQNAFNLGGGVFEPPDPYGAAGPAHVVNVGNVSIQWFTKDGTQQFHTSLSNFFAPLQPVIDSGSDFLFDPKIVYDQYSERFVALTLEMIDGNPAELSRIMLAVSDDSDPNGTWYYQDINSMVNINTGTLTAPTITSYWADYPGLAIDEEAIYVTCNMFEIGGNAAGGNRLWIADKGLGTGGLYDNGRSTVTMYDPADVTGLDFDAGLGVGQGTGFRSLQPAHVFGNAPGGVGTWLVAYDGNTNQTNELVDIIRVDNPLGTPTFTLETVDVGDIEDPVNYPFPIPQAAQRGSSVTIDGGDRRTVNAVWRNGSLYATTVIYPTDLTNAGDDLNQVTAHWFRFDTTNLSAATLADQGSIGGEELGFNVHTYWPAVMVDSHDNMAIGFSASGPTLYAGAYYAMRAVDDEPGTMRDAVAIAEGLDVYDLGGSRWGDYCSVALDPADEVTLWAYNEYALPEQGQGGRWGTRWGSFRMGELPAGPDPGPTTISGFKWHDLDDDGRRDDNEPALAGLVIHVEASGDDSQTDFGEFNARTNAAGYYSITLDTPGTYTIRESIPPGWTQTYPGEATNYSHTITISETGGEVHTDINFGNSDTVGFDHGDAPSPYPTLEADNGATHPVVAGFGLGTLIDGEPDALPDATASADDDNALADEDGVVLPDVLVPASTATAVVTISTGSRAQGRLHGWIDFNGDGDWDDPGEKIFEGLGLGAGTHSLDFSVPVNAEPGTTFARFRYGYEAELEPTGPSPRGGEVEDYAVNVLSDQPIANDDQFTVDQDSANNVLDVLANDVPSSSGSQSLLLKSIDWTGASGFGSINRNGTPADLTDDFIEYTPAPGAFGQDSFEYTIEDTVTGDEDTGTVIVTIQQSAGTRPIAVDDSFQVTSTSVLDLLANDRPGPDPPISITSIDTTGTSGSVTLIGGTVEYNPAGFTGTDQFAYTITDNNDVIDSATVTVHVPPHTANDLVSFRLETTDTNGAPITEIGQGLPFQVRVYVDDQRGEAGHPALDPGLITPDQGVFSAYMDLLYDAGLVSYGGDSGLEYREDEYSDEEYPEGHTLLDSGVPGVLDELGAFQGLDSLPLGPNEQFLLLATFTASAKGTAVFRTDPADDIRSDTSLNHPEGQLNHQQIEFGTTSIEVVDSPDLVEIRLEATDLNGAPLPGNRIVSGNDFLLRAWVEDLRTNIPTLDKGVFSAYLDVFYDGTLARPGDITFGPLFTNGQKADTAAAGIINEVGAFQNFADPLPPPWTFPGEELLFEIRFTALTPPLVFGNLVFRGDPADEQPLNEVSVIKPDPGLSVPTAQVLYVDTDVITVVGAGGEGEFTNPTNPMDVNDDGQASPVDALILINYLNSQGSTDLGALAGAEGEPSSSHYYYDVNADMVISPLDVLGIISHLNSAGLQGGAEGESIAPNVETVADAVVESAEASLAIGLATLQSNETSDQRDSEIAHPASPNVVAKGHASSKMRGISPLEELADETAGLLEVLTDDLAEDVLGGWGTLPSYRELVAELV